MLTISGYRSFTSFITFIPRYFILIGAIVNGIVLNEQSGGMNGTDIKMCIFGFSLMDTFYKKKKPNASTK